MNSKYSVKGISLPVETIIIIAIAVLVMVVLAAFFIGGFGEPANSISHDSAFGKGCIIVGTQHGCDADQKEQLLNTPIAGYDPDGNGSPDTLLTACSKKGFDANTCWRACGCLS